MYIGVRAAGLFEQIPISLFLSLSLTLLYKYACRSLSIHTYINTSAYALRGPLSVCRRASTHGQNLGGASIRGKSKMGRKAQSTTAHIKHTPQYTNSHIQQATPDSMHTLSA